MSLKRKSSKGFTLVELLVTISIVAILSTVSVIGYTSFIKKSAIEADESLVRQLNIFTDAYLVKHYSNLPDDNRIIADVLEESGIKPLKLQSNQYGYDLWFKCSDKIFELKQNFLETDGYIKVKDDIYFDDNDIIQPGSTTNNPTQNDPSNDIQKEPKFVLEDFVQNEYSNQSAYVYGTGNAIYVGLETNDDGIITATELLTENIRIKELRDDGTYQCWVIVSIEYNGIINNNKIIIDHPGEQKIKFILQNSANNETNSYIITIYATNISSQDTYITLDTTKLNHSLELEKNNNTYNATIYITGLKKGLSISEYDPNTLKPYTNPLGTFDYQLNVQMVIIVNGIAETITAREMLDDGTVNRTFSELEGDLEELNCIIIYKYDDCNGITVEKRVQIK